MTQKIKVTAELEIENDMAIDDLSLDTTLGQLGTIKSCDVKYEEKYGLKLAINSFNVFTCFGPYLYDFGFVGVAWHSFFLGIIASRYRVSRIRNLFDTVSFSAISFAILASPFWDFIMNWFFLGTLIVCNYYCC